jgi:hypothetical protein
MIYKFINICQKAHSVQIAIYIFTHIYSRCAIQCVAANEIVHVAVYMSSVATLRHKHIYHNTHMY